MFGRSHGAWLVSLALILLAVFPAGGSLEAQSPGEAGSLDVSFSDDGFVTTAIGDSAEGHAVAVQSDGRIVVAGFSNGGVSQDLAVVRYRANGALDETFGSDGIVTTDINSGSDDYGMGLAVQSDGRIVVAGRSGGDFVVVRYRANGALDETFGSDGMVTTDINSGSDDYGEAVAVQPDGKIVVAGFTWIGGDSDVAVVRYTAAGELDTTFGGDGIVMTDIGLGKGNDRGYAVAVQPDRKIVVAGRTNASPNDAVDDNILVIRYTAAGALDTTFESNEKPRGGEESIPCEEGKLGHAGAGVVITCMSQIGSNDFGEAVALQPDRKIVVAGYYSDIVVVIRYLPDGDRDYQFKGDQDSNLIGKISTTVGSTTKDEGRAVAVQRDGKVVVAGVSDNKLLVIRYEESGGRTDSSFGDGDGIVTTSIDGDTEGNAIALQNDGKIVVAGSSLGRFMVARFHGKTVSSPPPDEERDGGGRGTGSGGRGTGGGGGGGGGGGTSGGGGGGEEEPPPGASDVFTDIRAGAWYEYAVTWMIDNNITRGCTPTTFCPQANVTRQQFVTFLWRAAGQPTPKYTGSQAFADIGEDSYSDQAIGWAVANNITRGCTPGNFGDGSWQFCPTQQVTRGQMATLLYRHTEATYQGGATHYTDVPADAFYTPAVTWLSDFSVVPGCDVRLWCPNRPATRAEAALFINGVALRPHIWGEGNTSFTPQPH